MPLNDMYLKVTDLKKELKKLSDQELRSVIVESFKKSDQMKEYLSVKFNTDKMLDNLFQKYKEQIINEFFPNKGSAKMRLSVAKQAIKDYKKVTNDEEGTFELILIYVETGVRFTNTYGDIDEPFYNSMISMYKQLGEICSGNSTLFIRYKERINAIVDNANGIGWGFYDTLAYLHDEMIVDMKNKNKYS